FKHYKNDTKAPIGQTLSKFAYVSKPGDKWYAMCKLISSTDGTEAVSGVVLGGVVIQSASGNNVYNAEAFYVDGLVVAVKINFVSDQFECMKLFAGNNFTNEEL